MQAGRCAAALVQTWAVERIRPGDEAAKGMGGAWRPGQQSARRSAHREGCMHAVLISCSPGATRRLRASACPPPLLPAALRRRGT